MNLNRKRQQSNVNYIAWGWRPVSLRRAKKLRNRGEEVKWLPEAESFAWLPEYTTGVWWRGSAGSFNFSGTRTGRVAGRGGMAAIEGGIATAEGAKEAMRRFSEACRPVSEEARKLVETYRKQQSEFTFASGDALAISLGADARRRVSLLATGAQRLIQESQQADFAMIEDYRAKHPEMVITEGVHDELLVSPLDSREHAQMDYAEIEKRVMAHMLGEDPYGREDK